MNARTDLFVTFVRNAPRFLFFTGKGGVGKTTITAAVGLRRLMSDGAAVVQE